MNTNIVDIILPIYKPNETVFEAINSILTQTYSKWHLYVIDDASIDGSLDKIREKYLDYSDKITFFQFNENKRAAACRNYAIKQGKGEYIAFIDQDDVWLPNKLKLQINYFKNNDVDAVHGNVQFIDSENDVIGHDKWEAENQTRREVDWDGLSKEELARKIFLKPNIRIISSMVSREIFEKIGGFKEQFFGGEDALFWFEITLYGRIGYIDQILIKRRIHNNNTFKKYSAQRIEGKYISISYFYKFYGNLLKDILPIKRIQIIKSLIRYKIFKLKVISAIKLIYILFISYLKKYK